MKKMVFESNLLPDGHLYCPEELAENKNVHFKVIAFFDEGNFEATEQEIEMSNINDVSEDFLSDEELKYYLALEPL